MKDMLKLARAAVMAVFLLVVVTLIAFAQEAGEAIVPIVDLLDNPIVLFGIGGGTIVTVVISVLKYFGIVGKDAAISSDAANFILSLLVTALGMVTSGMPWGTAIATAFTSIVWAVGAHHRVGHTIQNALGNK